MAFIRWPFLIEGMLLGLVGAVIAVLCVGEFYHFITMEVSESLAFFPLVPMFPFFYDVAIYILVGGIIVGAIGSTIFFKTIHEGVMFMKYNTIKSRLVATIFNKYSSTGNTTIHCCGR